MTKWGLTQGSYYVLRLPCFSDLLQASLIDLASRDPSYLVFHLSPPLTQDLRASATSPFPKYAAASPRPCLCSCPPTADPPLLPTHWGALAHPPHARTDIFPRSEKTPLVPLASPPRLPSLPRHSMRPAVRGLHLPPECLLSSHTASSTRTGNGVQFFFESSIPSLVPGTWETLHKFLITGHLRREGLTVP